MFIVPIPVDKKFRVEKKFTAVLATDSKFMHCAFASNCMELRKATERAVCAVAN